MSKPRRVKLLCPSLSKLVELEAWVEQRLDFASIARAFGLHPSTVKINGHFISRGVDLVSNSVTWRSLLKYFAAKGLSTGQHYKDPLIVDGKLCKVGSKRSYDCQDATDGWIPHKIVPRNIGTSQGPEPEDMQLPRSKKLRDSSSSGCDYDTFSNGLGIKRKDSLEDLCFLKKLRINDTNSDFQGKINNCSSRTQFKCSYFIDNMKWPRENEAITATPCKKIR